ncbi:Uncharacterised protein [Mycobacteroides abscessus subsp. abscessus]|nr:Uncharacterised protein [Mycobacteroides abscessus subsp. abscessus]SIC88918.1 Uncharacterised protein [Mycobacteroides abscessus subsp. abscessus]SID09277.1 Uncharacterised protein [Mycobacteroides abscessus subsp. abscessus]SID53905.1 Uncharacterised protein [Mycobacteroides abscessus subsp. abscessus]SKT54444.1 Uncharacterised protein [Mycobacteroides abscessus subsp. abscessus]
MGMSYGPGMIGVMSTDDGGLSRVETILAAHECAWGHGGDWDCGQCGCGLSIASESDWVRHSARALVSALWTPGSAVIKSARALDVLPSGATVLGRPGPQSQVYRRIASSEDGMVGWRDLLGVERPAAVVVPAVVLEYGYPMAPAA